MEKKFKVGDRTRKIVYASVIAILALTAIVIGIVSAASKAPETPSTDNPPVVEGEGGGSGATDETPAPDDGKDDEKETLSFISPVVGKVVKNHSLSAPVFSLTLGEWRVHAGIDISCEEGASVYASEDGVVTGIYQDPLLGYTVELSHGEIKTRYSNLDSDAKSLKVGDEVKSGDMIGKVGDSSVSELADEPHLHFEVVVKDGKVNPLDYISEESKRVSLGIVE